MPTEAYQWTTQDHLRDHMKFLEDDSFSTEKHCCKGCKDKVGCEAGGAAYSLPQDRWRVGFPRDPWLLPKTSPDSPPDLKTGSDGIRGSKGDKRKKKKDHVTTVSPRKVICGPDVTAYLVDQVILWAAEFSKKAKALEEYEKLFRVLPSFPDSQDFPSTLLPSFAPPSPSVKRSTLFLDHVTGEGDMNRNGRLVATDPSGKKKCPINCKDSIWLCDHCLDSDVPEDIAFGVIGSYLFAAAELRHKADLFHAATKWWQKLELTHPASWFAGRGWEPERPEVHARFDIGFRLFRRWGRVLPILALPPEKSGVPLKAWIYQYDSFTDDLCKKVKAGLKDKKIKARACKRCKAKMK